MLLTPAGRPPAATGDLPPMSVLNARMMAAACETVLWRDDDGERHDLEVRLDGRLARLLGHPLPAGMSYADLGVLEVVERAVRVADGRHRARRRARALDAEPDRRGRRGGSVTAELAAELGLRRRARVRPGRFLRADPVERPLLVAALEHAARFRARARRGARETRSSTERRRRREKRGGRKG